MINASVNPEARRAALRALAARQSRSSTWRRLALLTAACAAQACLSVPWARALSNSIAALNPLALSLFVFGGSAGAMLTVFLIDRWNPPGPLRPILPVAGLIVSIDIGLTAVLNPGRPAGDVLIQLAARVLRAETLVTPDIVMIALTIAAWWSGLNNARRSFGVESMRTALQIGVAVWLLFVVFNTIHSHDSAALFVAGYFLFMLMGLALARSEDLLAYRLVSRTMFGAGWFAASSLTALAVVALGLAAWAYAIPAIAAMIWAALSLLIRAVFVVGAIFLGLIGALQPGGAGGESATTVAPGGTPFSLSDNATLDAQQATQVVQAISTVVFAVLFILIVILIVLLSRRYRRVPRKIDLSPGEEDALKTGAAAKRGDAAGGLNRILRRLRGGPARWLAELTIRRIYAQTLGLAASCGLPRPAFATPYEHLPALTRLFAANEIDVRLITEAYVRAHYGELPDTPDRLDEVRGAFQRVRAEAAAIFNFHREEERKAQRRVREALLAKVDQDRPASPR